MTKVLILIFTMTMLSACHSSHAEHTGPKWFADVVASEGAPVRTLPVQLDDYSFGIPYSSYVFEAKMPMASHDGHLIKRNFFLIGKGEQKVLAQVECDLSKVHHQGPAGEKTLQLGGTQVRFYCLLNH